MLRTQRTREEIHTARVRREEKNGREQRADKWTGMLKEAVEACGFRLVPENNGMLRIIDPDHREVVAHAPKHVSSKRVLGSIAEASGIPMSFVLP